MTGLPAAGKSTIAAALEERLVSRAAGRTCSTATTCATASASDLGFSPCDRKKNISRVGEIAAMFADAGAIAIVALVSPYRAARRAVRARHARDGLQFVEVFVDTPLDTCVERDPKGLYARARAGELKGLTGVDDPYERPRRPDLRVTQDMTSPRRRLDPVMELIPLN